MNKFFIEVTNEIELVHCWPEAPTEMYYLRTPHRHMMHIRTKMQVMHNDRELEIISVKHALDYFLHNTHFELRVSCEMIAERIVDYLVSQYGDRAIMVRVLEDNENGAVVNHTKEELCNEEN